ncbi:RNA methyltransferase [Bacillus aquiflavi]|uniref:RNA methyltransferase n=1 Tax=Bacillus aquiflavi TaxID=2672567 RepID=A0A6B3W3W1_9BACI|nr:RNA methyltransferase [Bacillus aquiflavi]MBA4538324.1 RNA methyltransferase [Bacillus aquiflavi]NEY82643.1 RNA methyltransferase [Bacillus aquiflavi]
MNYIHSIKNPRVKQWRKLLGKKERDKTGTFLIEGFHLVEEALHEGRIIEIIINEKIKIREEWNVQSIPVFIVSDEIISLLTETETPQGICAVCNQDHHNNSIEDGNTFLLIDAVQDPGNLGTMIRTADAAGIDCVVVGEGSTDIYNPKVVRSAQGSHFHLPIVRGNLTEWIKQLNRQNIPVYGTALENGMIYSDIKRTHSFALIVGNEGNGVDKQLLTKTDSNLYIPIYGKSESLNVAVATGILLYYLKGY